ncbi:hypothetical protein B0J11DRAFT_261629 [Dendryphion nanum]|uniref:Extracellular membrane protein CFEM domain-containing protein n=1 Tax=Dendryphion nanum TaxID=256645 RepID=A0A9P9ISH7_9PLEO|nr:hypothetical protein B0J11DRAFT_261629 [Dendryphion nanum]
MAVLSGCDYGGPSPHAPSHHVHPSTTAQPTRPDFGSPLLSCCSLWNLHCTLSNISQPPNSIVAQQRLSILETLRHIQISPAMRTISSFSALSFATFALSVSATTPPRFDWVNGLSSCWRDCLKRYDDGCTSSKCICDASQSNTFLPEAVSCIYRNCKDGKIVELGLIVTAQTYCALAGNPIPDEVITSAYAATTSKPSSTAPPPLTTRKVDNSPKTTTRQGDAQLTKVYTTTFTQTSKDKDGNTLLIEIPIVMGPNTLSSGKPFTTTLDKQTSASSDSSSSSTSAVASTSSTPEVTAPPPVTLQQPQAASSTATARSTQRFNSNGSPFENTNDAAGRWGISGVAIGMGVIGGLLMRLLG